MMNLRRPVTATDLTHSPALSGLSGLRPDLKSFFRCIFASRRDSLPQPPVITDRRRTGSFHLSVTCSTARSGQSEASEPRLSRAPRAAPPRCDQAVTAAVVVAESTLRRPAVRAAAAAAPRTAAAAAPPP
jgi:hypothetical protein